MQALEAELDRKEARFQRLEARVQQIEARWYETQTRLQQRAHDDEETADATDG